MAKRLRTEWELWTYDVWGNAKDGYEVNDRCKHGTFPLRLAPTVNNAGTEHEFTSHFPTDRQIKSLFGVRCRIDTDGDDVTIYVNRERDGYPLGELHCVSHDKL